MNDGKWYIYFSFILAVLVQLIAFGFAGWIWGGVGDILLAGVWVAGVRTRKDGLLHAAWLLTIAWAILGGLNGAAKGGMLLSILFALAAWDLAFFLRRLDANIPPPSRRHLQLEHLKILGWILGLSLFISLPVLSLNLQLGYGWLLLLAVAAAFSLSRFIFFWQRRMRK